ICPVSVVELVVVRTAAKGVTRLVCCRFSQRWRKGWLTGCTQYEMYGASVTEESWPPGISITFLALLERWGWLVGCSHKLGFVAGLEAMRTCPVRVVLLVLVAGTRKRKTG